MAEKFVVILGWPVSARAAAEVLERWMKKYPRIENFHARVEASLRRLGV